MIQLSDRFKDRVASLYKSQTGRARQKQGPSGRISKKGYALPFDQKQFTAWIVDKFGSENGVIRCRYCKRPLDIYSCVIDHAIPLKRSGGPGLENLDAICDEDNCIKGQLTPDEYEWFLGKLAEMSARFPGSKCVTDITSRLQKTVKLAAGMRFHMAQKAKQKAVAILDEGDF